MTMFRLTFRVRTLLVLLLVALAVECLLANRFYRRPPGEAAAGEKLPLAA